MIIEFFAYAALAVCIGFPLHVRLVGKRNRDVRRNITEYYIKNSRYYSMNATWDDVILDYCNEFDESPTEVFSHFSTEFIGKQTVFSSPFLT